MLPAHDGRVEAVIDYLWALPHGESQFVTVDRPRALPRQSLVSALAAPHWSSRSSCGCSVEPGVVVTNVPALAEHADEPPPRAPSAGSSSPARTPRRCAPCTTRARSALEDTKAVFFAFDAEEAAQPCGGSGRSATIPADLEIDEAPFRDIGEPLLRHLRAITADPEAVAVVVMPELVFRGWRRLLHNQRALYIKRLLLFEPRVILAAVPYRLN